ncbi:hypothetical protein J437_LFUL000929 [Ladona fulva]|uniref:Structural maintenance of chromosomes protein 5 n=1 Tax=Ladona fulva TaxID=123851 RepID=A0A8K0KBJ5_LADFU|nr:hypothetical protein J437_LFUL000929 [Ladona fulva]
MQSKQALQDKLDRLQQKQAYQLYLKSKDDLDMSEKLLGERVAVREALEVENRPFQIRVTNEKKKILEIDEKIKNTFELPESINDKIRENVNDFERWCINEKKHQEKLKDARRQIDFLENTLKEMANSEDGFRKQDAKLIAEEKEVMKSIFDIQKKKQTLDMKILNVEHQMKLTDTELSRARDVGELKLRKLKAEGLYEPIMWFRKHKDQLKGKAYEPMAMVINMKSEGMAKYLESIVPRRDLVAFICEDPDDANFLMEELRDKGNYKVNVITSKPTTPLTSFTRPYNLGDLREFGFHSFVSDIFTAPETVKRYLFQNYNLHRIPIGNETTYSKANEVPTEIRTFMTENKKFTTRLSKYTRETISSSTDLKPSVYLTASVNEDHIRECIKRKMDLSDEYKDLQKDATDLELQDKNFDEKLKEIKKSRSEIKGSLSKISSCQSRLANLKRTENELKERRNNEEEEKRKLEKKNQKYGDIILLMQLEQKESQKARHNVYLLEQDLRTNQKKMKEAEREETKFRSVVDGARHLTKKHLQQLEEYCRTKITSSSFKNILKDFEQLPDTLTDIEREIHVTQTKAECLGHSDNNAIAEYERRKRTLAAMKAAVEQLSSDLAAAKKKIEEVKSKWFPFVSDLVSKINRKFGDLLAKINYVGEVLLVQGQHEDDFANYGFKIQVKFRQEGGLQELNQFRQSGGERAVAIAIYLMSLQELTSVPFRCVDEINQGMDEFHESVVFKLLSGIVTGSDSAQYFLFTPKVLKNLEFPRELLFLCVNNGEVDCGECYKCRDFLNSKRKKNNGDPQR